ncbi:reverse transcriptase domain-containing protein, partial [Tanacetum coccineum]
MPEETLALVAQQMAHRQKRGSGKQKHVINREVKRKNRGAKEPKQTKQWTNNEISFPSMPGCQLVDSPIILEALIEGFQVYRIYVDRGSSSEVMYEHCFRNLGTETKTKLKEPKKPLGTIDLNVTMGEPGKLQTIMIEFMVVKSHSPYNIILGRTGLRSLGAVASTIHSMIKFPTANG